MAISYQMATWTMPGTAAARHSLFLKNILLFYDYRILHDVLQMAFFVVASLCLRGMIAHFRFCIFAILS